MSYLGYSLKGFTPLQRYGRCILPPQPTGQGFYGISISVGCSVPNPIYTYISKLVTVDKSDPKASFSIAAPPRWSGGRNSFFLDGSTYHWSEPYYAVLSNEASSTMFWVFGMTRPEIEPRPSGPLANTLIIIPLGRFFCRQLNDFKYFYQTRIIQLVIYLRTVKWFQILLRIINNSIKHQSFVYTQLNDQTVLFLTIRFNRSHLFAQSLNCQTVPFEV